MRLTKHSPAKIWLGADDNRPRDYPWRRHLRRPEWSMENLGCQTSGAGAGPKSSTTNAIPVHPRMGIWILSNQPARSLEAYTTSPIFPEPPHTQICFPHAFLCTLLPGEINKSGSRTEGNRVLTELPPSGSQTIPSHPGFVHISAFEALDSPYWLRPNTQCRWWWHGRILFRLDIFCLL